MGTYSNVWGVSVLWGAGRHYFVGNPAGTSRKHADEIMEGTVERLKHQRRYNKRGAKPVVRLWCMEREEKLE